MTEVQELAVFVDRVQLGDLSELALEQLKIRVIDTIGVAIGALTASPIVAIGALTKQLGGRPIATLIGGGKTVPIGRLSSTERLVAISISWIATLLQARPAIHLTIWARCSPLPKWATGAASLSSRRLRSPTKFKHG